VESNIFFEGGESLDILYEGGSSQEDEVDEGALTIKSKKGKKGKKKKMGASSRRGSVGGMS
jgi:hypothetical protein